MKLVFDTSTLSSLLSNDDDIVKAFANQDTDQVIIPLATDAELRFGFTDGNRRSDNLANYKLFKKEFNVVVTFPDQDTAIIYGDLATWAKQHGISLSNNDLWIASTCIQVGGNLFTLDGDFKNLPQLRLIDF
ncbi:MAG TPA: PIN domain-containing protein [Candidatus Binatia bacterium]|nr:PIN domain-containing protein [Candidatus Binatia bacterium]